MEGNCLVKMEVENNNKVKEEKIYIGATENEWDKRYYNHNKLSFKHSKYKNAMMLSTYYWKIKREVSMSPKIT